jgi:hypothetical protein
MLQGMRRVTDRQERLAALFLVLGSAIEFGPVVWLVERWLDALARDPGGPWGARWIGERLSNHPYLTGGALLLGVALAGGLVMLVLFTVAKRLAARYAGRARYGRR